MTAEAGIPSLRGSLAQLGRQSLVYGLGTVVARVAALFLLPVYTHYLSRDDLGRVETLVALVAVGATVAQLGMVNALFRFAVERDGSERLAVVRTAIGFMAATALAAALLGVALTPFAAPALLGEGESTLWLVACGGLWLSVANEAAVGIYRIEGRPWRFVAITILNVAITVVVSVIAVVGMDAGATGLLVGSYAGTAVAVAAVAIDRRRVLIGPLAQGLLRPMLRFGLPFMPSRLALWALSFSSRLLLVGLGSLALAGLFAPAVRLASVVALLVTAFQLAWPPFAYGIRDDAEARRVYRAVLTAWVGLATWVVLGLALLRRPLLDAVAPDEYLGGADAMAIMAAGLALYGAYYVVAVSVGRAKRTQFNWVVTGMAAVVNVALCVALIPGHGVDGAALAGLVAYAAMAGLMAIWAEHVFPVGYQWFRIALIVALGAGLFALGDRALSSESAAGIAARFALAAAFPLALLPFGLGRLLRPVEAPQG